jgi:hypothetical protein
MLEMEGHRKTGDSRPAEIAMFPNRRNGDENEPVVKCEQFNLLSFSGLK